MSAFGKHDEAKTHANTAKEHSAEAHSHTTSTHEKSHK